MPTPQLFGVMSVFATCALPGCQNPVTGWGDVCADCRAAFGDEYLRPAPDGPPITEQILAERDAGVVEAMRAQRAVAVIGAASKDAGRRRNQRCWLCEGRHTCTQTPYGWECDDCRTVQ